MFGFCNTDFMPVEKTKTTTMKTFYCVVSKFFDGGGVKAILFDVKADKKPVNVQVENNLCDEYHDYFDTYEDAYKFWQDVYKA